MVYLFLVVSLTLNLYLIFKVKKLKKFLNEFYCSEEELDDVLNRL